MVVTRNSKRNKQKSNLMLELLKNLIWNALFQDTTSVHRDDYQKALAKEAQKIRTSTHCFFPPHAAHWWGSGRRVRSVRLNH